jgi:hypothetical protein
VCERNVSPQTPEHLAFGHYLRYRLALGYMEPGWTVLDAACGTGYAKRLFEDQGTYVGVDKFATFPWIEEVDLNTWRPPFAPEMTMTFETIEHLDDPETFVLNTCAKTRRVILASVPVVPTMANNPYHKRDFEPGELPSWPYFESYGWKLQATLQQPDEFSEIYVWTR